MAEELQARIARIMVEALFLEFRPEEIGYDQPLAEYGIDSFLLLELLSAIQAELGVELKPADISADNLKTVNSLAALLQSKMA